jgi:hypothetical protein
MRMIVGMYVVNKMHVRVGVRVVCTYGIVRVYVCVVCTWIMCAYEYV